MVILFERMLNADRLGGLYLYLPVKQTNHYRHFIDAGLVIHSLCLDTSWLRENQPCP